MSRGLLIVVHSRTGGARQMAAAAAAGARAAASLPVTVQAAQRTRPEHLLAAGAYLFAGPENLAGLSGPMKDFFDRCYYPVLGQIEGRAYACLICAGSDGQGAATQLARIATGWRLRVVAPPLIVCTGAQSPADIAAPKRIAAAQLARCHELGAQLAAGLEAGIY